jgi:heat shock protein HslJ
MRKPIPTLALAVVVALTLAACSSGSGLTGKTWQLTATTTKVPASQSVVADPQNYTIEFRSDGTFSAKADCNSVAGTYTTSGSELTITLGPSTLAFCGEESVSDVYLTGLGNAAGYAIASNQLTITTKDEATMTFK